MTSQERLRYRRKPTAESQSPTLQRSVQGLFAMCVSPIVQTLQSSQDNTACNLLRNHICHKWRVVDTCVLAWTSLEVEAIFRVYNDLWQSLSNSV